MFKNKVLNDVIPFDDLEVILNDNGDDFDLDLQTEYENDYETIRRIKKLVRKHCGFKLVQDYKIKKRGTKGISRSYITVSCGRIETFEPVHIGLAPLGSKNVLEEVAVLFHELAHSTMHVGHKMLTKGDEEVVAELTAFILMRSSKLSTISRNVFTSVYIGRYLAKRNKVSKLFRTSNNKRLVMEAYRRAKVITRTINDNYVADCEIKTLKRKEEF